MNIQKLKGKIVEKGMNVEALASAIGVDRATMYRKLNAGEKISVGEANKIRDVLELTIEDAIEIFFGK